MKLRRIFVILALFAVPLAACGDDQDPAVTGDRPTTTEAGDDGGIPSFTIVTEDHSYDIPDDLTGGVIELTLQNNGEDMHEAMFISLPEEVEIDELLADMKEVEEGGPIPDYIQTLTGVFEVEPGDSHTTIINLPAGRYAVIDTLPVGLASWDDEEGAGPPGDDENDAEGDDPAEGEEPGEGEGPDEGETHADLGMYEIVEITEENDLELPDLDGRVAIRDYSFDLPDITPGTHELMAVNDGDEFHHVLFFEWPEEVDGEERIDEIMQIFFEGGEGPPPEGTPEPDEAGYSGIFSTGLGGSFEATFQSGRWYTAICFIHDRTGGPPHAMAHQMYQHFFVD